MIAGIMAMSELVHQPGDHQYAKVDYEDDAYEFLHMF